MSSERGSGGAAQWRGIPGGRSGWWAAVIAVVALTATRYGAAWFSYAFDGYADEPAVIEPALNAARGDFRPSEFLYPGFTSYTTGFVFWLLDACGYGGAEGFLPERPGPDHFVVGRLVVFAVSLATLVFTALAARRFFGVWAGVSAAALCACSPLYTGMSVISNVNAPASLWTIAAIYFSARVYYDGRKLRDYLLAGACAGLAVGSKYNSYSACLALAAAHFLAPGATPIRDAKAWLRSLGPLIGGGIAAVAAFFAITPYALIEPARFVEDLGYLSDIYKKHWPLHTNPSGRTWSDYVERMWSFGWPREMFVAAAFGLVVTLVRDARAAVVVGVAALFNYAFLGLYPVYFLRHFLPAVPTFALFSGAAVQWTVERVAGGARANSSSSPSASSTPAPLSARRRWMAAGLALVMTAALGARALDLSQSRIAKAEMVDSRAAAREWIDANVPAGARIVCEERSPFESDANPRYQVRILRCLVTPDQRAEVEQNADYVLLTLMGSAKLLKEPSFAGSQERYDEFAARHELVVEFLGRGIQYAGRDIRIYKIRSRD
jgi:hypothetical protein